RRRGHVAARARGQPRHPEGDDERRATHASTIAWTRRRGWARLSPLAMDAPSPPRLKVGIPKETFPGERRVAATPTSVARIAKLGVDVIVEAGAGEAASFLDSAYAEAGAVIVPDATTLHAQANIVLKVRAPFDTGAGH